MTTRSVGLYRSKKTRAYLVQTMCPHPLGGDVAIGAPIVLNSDELEARLVSCVLDALERYRSVRWEPSLSRRRPPGFRREHDFVSLMYDEQRDEMELVTTQAEDGGYHGTRKGALCLRLQDAAEKLVPAVREAFDRLREG